MNCRETRSTSRVLSPSHVIFACTTLAASLNSCLQAQSLVRVGFHSTDHLGPLPSEQWKAVESALETEVLPLLDLDWPAWSQQSCSPLRLSPFVQLSDVRKTALVHKIHWGSILGHVVSHASIIWLSAYVNHFFLFFSAITSVSTPNILETGVHSRAASIVWGNKLTYSTDNFWK